MNRRHLSRDLPVAVTSQKRSPALPNMATMTEALQGYERPLRTGIFAPASSSSRIAEKLAGEIRKATASPELAAERQELDAEGRPMSPAEFTACWKQQVDLCRTIVKDDNIKLAED